MQFRDQELDERFSSCALSKVRIDCDILERSTVLFRFLLFDGYGYTVRAS